MAKTDELDLDDAIGYFSEERYSDMLKIAAIILSEVRTKSGIKRNPSTIIFDLAEASAFEDVATKMINDYK